MKGLLLTVTLFILIASSVKAQTGVLDKIIVRQGLYLRDYQVDSIQRDTLFIGRVKSFPTSDAVYNFVKGRIPDVSQYVASSNVRSFTATDTTQWGLNNYVIGGTYIPAYANLILNRSGGLPDVVITGVTGQNFATSDLTAIGNRVHNFNYWGLTVNNASTVNLNVKDSVSGLAGNLKLDPSSFRLNSSTGARYSNSVGADAYVTFLQSTENSSGGTPKFYQVQTGTGNSPNYEGVVIQGYFNNGSNVGHKFSLLWNTGFVFDRSDVSIGTATTNFSVKHLPNKTADPTDSLILVDALGKFWKAPVISGDGNTYITSGTYSAGTLTLSRNDAANVVVTGFTDSSVYNADGILTGNRTINGNQKTFNITNLSYGSIMVPVSGGFSRSMVVLNGASQQYYNSNSSTGGEYMNEAAVNNVASFLRSYNTGPSGSGYQSESWIAVDTNQVYLYYRHSNSAYSDATRINNEMYITRYGYSFGFSNLDDPTAKNQYVIQSLPNKTPIATDSSLIITVSGQVFKAPYSSGSGGVADGNTFITSGTYSSGIITLTNNDASTVTITGLPTNNNQLTNGANYLVANGAITPNTGTKITYDAKGLVTGSTSLIASDIPSLDAAKITTGNFNYARIATGTPVAGYIPTYQSDGSIVWQAQSGGSQNDTVQVDGNAGLYVKINSNGSDTISQYPATDSQNGYLTSVDHIKISNAVLITGTYSNPSWLTALDAAKLTTGQIATGRIATGTASEGYVPKIVSGVLTWAADASGTGSSTFASLTDVTFTGLVDKDIAYYDNATSKWKNTAGTFIDMTGFADGNTVVWKQSTSSFVKKTLDTTQTITTGTATTITASAKKIWVKINPSSTLASHTITLPATSTLNDNDEVIITAGGTLTSGVVVTSLTIVANTGETIIQATTPNSISAGEFIAYKYSAANQTLYRINY